MPAALEQPKHKVKPIGRPKVEQERPYSATKAIQTYIETGSIKAASRKTGLAWQTVKDMLERNPEAFADSQKLIATQALSNSALMSSCVTKSKVKKLNALQMVIGAKVSGQHALEMLGTTAPLVTINVAVLDRAGDVADLLRARLAMLEHVPTIDNAMSKPTTTATIDTTIDTTVEPVQPVSDVDKPDLA